MTISRVLSGVSWKARGFLDVSLLGSAPFFTGITEPSPDNSGLLSNVSDLTLHEGDFVFSADNQVCTGKRITGSVIMGNYSNTVLRNCLIEVGVAPTYGVSKFGVAVFGTSGNNRLIEHNEIRPSSPSVDTYGISGWGYTARRNVIVDVVDSFNVHRSANQSVHSAQIISNYVECLFYAVDPRQTDGSHNDGVQVFSGSINRVEGNSFHGPDRKGNGIVLTPNSTTGAAQLKNMSIINNWVYGYYTQIAAWDASGTFDAVSNLTIKGNRHIGLHQWDVLITAENNSLATDISGNVKGDGSPAFIYINN